MYWNIIIAVEMIIKCIVFLRYAFFSSMLSLLFLVAAAIIGFLSRYDIKPSLATEPVRQRDPNDPNSVSSQVPSGDYTPL